MPERILSATDLEQIGRVVGPTIREGVRSDLSAQTEDIRAIVTAHENSMRSELVAHEGNDEERFTEGDKRMEKIEVQLNDVTGAVRSGKALIGVLIVATPFLVEWIKHLLKW